MSAVPIEIMCHNGVRFTVPGGYGDQELDGHWSWPDFDGAVKAARSTIRRLDYPTGHQETRAFVALRLSSTYARTHNLVGGNDREALRWEVFRDRVVLVPTSQGGLSDKQRDAARSLPASKIGKASGT